MRSVARWIGSATAARLPRRGAVPAKVCQAFGLVGLHEGIDEAVQVTVEHLGQVVQVHRRCGGR